MHLFHIPHCSIQNRNVHISVLNGALWDMEQMQSGNCELGQFWPSSIPSCPVYCDDPSKLPSTRCRLSPPTWSTDPLSQGSLRVSCLHHQGFHKKVSLSLSEQQRAVVSQSSSEAQGGSTSTLSTGDKLDLTTLSFPLRASDHGFARTWMHYEPDDSGSRWSGHHIDLQVSDIWILPHQASHCPLYTRAPIKGHYYTLLGRHNTWVTTMDSAARGQFG